MVYYVRLTQNEFTIYHWPIISLPLTQHVFTMYHWPIMSLPLTQHGFTMYHWPIISLPLTHLLQVFCVILLFDISVVLMLPCWPDVTIVQSDITIVVLQWQLSTGSIHDYRFCYFPLVGILFEVLRIVSFLVANTDKLKPRWHLTYIDIILQWLLILGRLTLILIKCWGSQILE